jgi:hypothetical protein
MGGHLCRGFCGRISQSLLQIDGMGVPGLSSATRARILNLDWQGYGQRGEDDERLRSLAVERAFYSSGGTAFGRWAQCSRCYWLLVCRVDRRGTALRKQGQDKAMTPPVTYIRHR